MATQGERLRALRFEHGNLTLEDVEKATGVDASHLSQAENNKRGLSIEKLTTLATFYRESLDWIRCLTDDRRPCVAYPTITDREITPGIVAHESPLPPGLTADSPQEDWTAFLADAITRSGINLDNEGRRQIAEAAAAVVATLAKQRTASVAKKQTSRQDKDSTV